MEDTDLALCQSHPGTGLLVALRCTGSGNLVTFTEWIWSKNVRLYQFVCVVGVGGVVDKVVNLFLSSFLYLAGFFKTLSPNGPFAINSYLQSSYYKN